MEHGSSSSGSAADGMDAAVGRTDGRRDGGRGVAELARSEIAGGGGVGRFEAC